VTKRTLTRQGFSRQWKVFLYDSHSPIVKLVSHEGRTYCFDKMKTDPNFGEVRVSEDSNLAYGFVNPTESMIALSVSLGRIAVDAFARSGT
jgi:hypothetical protein